VKTLRQYRILAIGLLCLAFLGSAGAVYGLQARIAGCKAVPFVAAELLPNADLAQPGGPMGLPQGWSGAAAGAALGEFAVDGDRRALQLMGVANAIQTPAIAVEPGQRYCFSGQAISDAPNGAGTRVRLSFNWLGAAGETIAADTTEWQPVVLWRADAPPARWSQLSGAFQAPANATTLAVRIHPAGDDRIYLDDLHVRRGGVAQARPQPVAVAPALATVERWPDGARAAVSFSFDWETAMGGLTHSISVDDPYRDQDPLLRAGRMRQGVTTTLELFRPYGIRATYYANGYNFLLGNTERRSFMGNPTFRWADNQSPHRWPSDYWAKTPWFAADPYGTVQSDPDWYFGDLVPRLQQAQQSIESHTFSHFYGGFASPDEWQADLAAWAEIAQERGVAPARSLAFPWSSSGGMSDANWSALEQAGITSVTRTSHQPQYRIADAPDHRCNPVPGHEIILACPDFYLTERSAEQARATLDQTIANRGVIDFWAHTEEVVSPMQIAAWSSVVQYAAQQRDQRQVWIAPLAEITDWQRARDQVQISEVAPAAADGSRALRIVNGGAQQLDGLTLALPATVDQVMRDGKPLALEQRPDRAERLLTLDLAPGQTIDLTVAER
jgi:hypothetical protein